MADCFLLRRGSGGGGGNTYAFANITFNEGDIVTATDGTTVLYSDTSGSYVFAIPDQGTWTFTDGDDNSQTKVFSQYGESWSGDLGVWLKYSDRSTILTEAKRGKFILQENVGGDIYVANYPYLTLDDVGDVVTTDSCHLYYDLGALNTPTTVYFVGKCAISAPEPLRIVAIYYSNTAGNTPCFYKNRGMVYTTVYGSDVDTGVSATSLFVCALSINGSGTAKYNVNNTHIESKAYTTAGRYIYFSGTPSDPFTPTQSTQYGGMTTISYIGVVSGTENDDVIAANIGSLKERFGIS